MELASGVGVPVFIGPAVKVAHCVEAPSTLHEMTSWVGIELCVDVVSGASVVDRESEAVESRSVELDSGLESEVLVTKVVGSADFFRVVVALSFADARAAAFFDFAAIMIKRIERSCHTSTPRRVEKHGMLEDKGIIRVSSAETDAEKT